MFSASTRRRVLKRIRLDELLNILSENESEISMASIATNNSMHSTASSSTSDSFQDLLVKNSDLPIPILVEAIILKLIAKSNLSKTQINAVILGLHLIFKRSGIQCSLLPRSVKSIWNKHCDKSKVEYWFYCASSHAHGPLKGEPRFFSGLTCGDAEVSTELALGSYCVHYSLSQQLGQILYAFFPIRYSENSEINDITDGERLISLKRLKQGEFIDSYYTLTLLTDELPVSNSSSMRVFPAFIQLNELPCDYRKMNLILTTVFYGRKKPTNSNAYLKPLLEELIVLSTTGLVWSDKNAQLHRSIFKLSTVIADAPMRAYLRGVMQYNSSYGCDWCKIRGNTHGGSMKFLYHSRESINSLERLNQELYLSSMHIFMNEATKKSFRHSSDLMRLPDFDIVWSFSVDILHAAFLGVVRDMIGKAWLHPKSRGKPYFIGDIKSIRQIDRRLSLIKVTSNIIRKPRKLSDLKQWKGNELAAFLCYYAYPVLSGILKHRFIVHFGLLAETILLLQKGPINQAKMERATQCIYQFHYLLQKLYGPDFMTYNAHILLHLPKSVKLLGPACFTSAFISENEMGRLKRLVRQYQTTSQNLVNLHLISNAFRELQNKELKNASRVEKQYFFDQKSHKNLTIRHVDQNVLPQNLDALLRRMRYAPELVTCLSQRQALWHQNKWITTRDYDSRHMKANHYVELRNQNFFEVIHILHSLKATLLVGYIMEPDKEAYKIYKAFNDSDPAFVIFHNMKKIVKINTNLTIIAAEEVSDIVIFTDVCVDKKLVIKPCLKWL